MKKFRTIVSVIVMCLAGIVGLFFGGVLDEAMGGAILFSMIAGIACVVYAIERIGIRNRQNKEMTAVWQEDLSG